MSYFEDASVVFIPSAVKDGKTYSIKPTDGSGDLTFSRGSDIEATRVASNGYIEKAAVNLLLQSNVFNVSPWASASMTLTSGQTGYDGSSDAWLIDSTGGYTIQGTSLSGVYTYSIYAKKGTADGIRLRMDAATDANCYIDLNDGSEIIATSGVALSVTSVGGGWWRISLTINDPSIVNVRFYATDAAGNSTTGTIYIQDAQVNYGLVAQEYQETTTTSVVSGITNDMPRLDYSGGASCPSLLLEPSRTNALSHSEYMGNGGSSVDRNTSETLSPEGVYNAAKVTGSTSYLADSRLTSVFSGNNVFSVFLKKGNDSVIGVYMYDGAYYRAGFNLDTGAVDSETNTTASIEPYGNGWYRCTILATTTANVAEVGLDGIAGFVYTYGWQHEYNVTYPTSYIPTYGTSATRTADDCVKSSATSIIGQTEGAVYFEWDYQNTGSTGGNIPISLDAGSGYNLYFWAKTDGNYLAECFNGGVAQFSFAGSMGSFGTKKIAIAYKNNDFALYINGVLANTDTSGTVPTLNRLYIGRFYLSAVLYNISSGIKQVLLFPTRLSNADLATLTTL